MPIKIYRGITFLLVALFLFQVGTVQAVEGVGADLFYLAPDDAGIMQVWKIGDDNQPNKLTAETSDIVGYDITYDQTLAYITTRSLSLGDTILSSGGPLDTPAVNLSSVSWSPDGTALAITVTVPEPQIGNTDPAEGLWLLDIASQSWTLLLTSARPDVPGTQMYTGAAWSPAGDRLLVNVSFYEGKGVALYNLQTQELLVFNITGTNGLIDERGYSRGSWSPDGNSLVFSDVPIATTGNGYIVSANDYTKITALLGAEAQSMYLSHPRLLREGVVYLLRDFINSSTETQLWENGAGGARQLGAFATADIYEALWSGRGDALVYLDDFDGKTGRGHLMVRNGDSFGEAALPEGVDRMVLPKWSADFTPPTSPDRVSALVFTEPLFDFVSPEGTALYTLKAQWNTVEDASSYRLNITPGIDGTSDFDVEGSAAQLGLLTCGTTYTVTVAALNADGTAGTASAPSTLFTPSCDEVTASAPDTSTETTETTESTETTETTSELPQTVATEEPEAPIGPSTVIDLSATEPAAANTLPDGTVLYGVTLTWTRPTEAFDLYLLTIDPPIGANQRAVFPVRSEDPTITLPVTDIVCSVQYNVRVQTLAADGSTILATSPVTIVLRPNCP